MGQSSISPVKRFVLQNPDNHCQSAEAVEYDNGNFHLQWNGKSSVHSYGETGWFLTFRALKMYVTQKVLGCKSIWKEMPLEEINE